LDHRSGIKILEVKLSYETKKYTVTVSPFAKYFYLVSGFLLVAIGVIGIFLPLLPTTIFLILASICFVKSSPRANEWLRNHKLLGGYIDNYQNKTGLTIKSKITNIILLWISISVSAFYLTDVIYIKILLFGIAVGVTIHLLMIKTKSD
jgi:uncharacterized membrane protein YbaN (DUF454 family)